MAEDNQSNGTAAAFVSKDFVGGVPYYATTGTAEEAIYKSIYDLVCTECPFGGDVRAAQYDDLVLGLAVDVNEGLEPELARKFRIRGQIKASTAEGYLVIMEIEALNAPVAGRYDYRVIRSTDDFLMSVIMRLT